MKKRNMRIISGILALTLLVSTNVFATTTSEYDAQISEVKAKQEQNEAEAAELNARLDALRSETVDAEAYQATLVEQIQNYQESIDLARARIDELNDSISALEDEIEKADAEYADTLEQLKVRLSALYKAGGDLTTLQILLDSTSLYDFSIRSEAMESVTRHDKQLMEQIKEYMLLTQEQRDELKVQKKDLESKQADLQVMEEENARLIEELQIQSAEAEDLIAENEAESAEYLSQLETLIDQRSEQAAREEEERQQALQNQQNQSGGSSGSGSNNDSSVLNTGSLSFSWPLAGYGYESITQYYGNNGHRGLDIGIPYGTPIYASESGQVISAEYHWSWGNNVLIWHNDTYSTRYAHCSSLAVSAGEYVQKGQVIGYAGSTGNSTGNHLHFEVYQNGDRVNPSNFV